MQIDRKQYDYMTKHRGQASIKYIDLYLQLGFLLQYHLSVPYRFRILAHNDASDSVMTVDL